MKLFLESGLKKPLSLFKTFFVGIGLLACSFLAWNYFGLFFIAFLLVFIHVVEKSNSEPIFRTIIKTLFLLFLWHFGALFWMLDVDKGFHGFLINLFIYFIPFSLFLVIKKKYQLSTFIFIPFLLLFEYSINALNFPFPWLTLGNLLANQTILIQWFELTGVIGGSFWVLILAYTLYKWISIKSSAYLSRFFTILFVPIIFSIILKNYRKKEFLYPNDDQKVIAYNNKYNTSIWERDKLTYYILDKIDTTQRYDVLLIPEQTIRGLDGRRNKNLAIQYFKDYLNKGIFKTIFIGTTGYRNRDTLVNSNIILTKTKSFRKVKKKLIPYTEYLPPVFYPFYKKKFYRGDVPDDLKEITKTLGVQPLICYEFIYSFFVAENMGDASQIYLTSSEKFLNDNSFALNQYDSFLCLRAIENRASITKASNNGWSLYIDPLGNIVERKNKEINIFNVPKFKKTTTFYQSWGVHLVLPILAKYMTKIEIC